MTTRLSALEGAGDIEVIDDAGIRSMMAIWNARAGGIRDGATILNDFVVGPVFDWFRTGPPMIFEDEGQSSVSQAEVLRHITSSEFRNLAEQQRRIGVKIRDRLVRLQETSRSLAESLSGEVLPG